MENLNYKITPVILAGGLGTRLRSIVGDLPKVLASVNGRPFLSYLLDQLITAGFSNIILCTGHKGDMVKDAFGLNYKGLNIRYSHEPEPLGTGGALRYALPMIENEIILVMNGDSFIDVDMCNFIGWYLKGEYDASILLTKVEDTSRYGCVKIGADGKVIRFEEKQGGLEQGWINAGVYLFKSSLLQSIPFGKPYSLERQFLPGLIVKSFYGYLCESNFRDIGTPTSYVKAGGFFVKKRVQHAR